MNIKINLYDLMSPGDMFFINGRMAILCDPYPYNCTEDPQCIAFSWADIVGWGPKEHPLAEKAYKSSYIGTPPRINVRQISYRGQLYYEVLIP